MTRVRKLSRPTHHYDQTAYFITTRTIDTRTILGEPNLARIAVDELHLAAQRYDFSVLAYCFMPDHAHFVIVPAPDREISGVMRILKGRIARAINEHTGNTGALWQQGFHDKAPRDLPALNQFIRYTEYNPVAARLVANASDYEFSSARGQCLDAYYRFVEEAAFTSRAESPRHGEADEAPASVQRRSGNAR
jgi:REP element-mobilizing transposase RayT